MPIVFLWDNENIPELDYGDSCKHYKYTKNQCIVYSKWVNFIVCQL